ncbi:FAD dependent oxidoreductase [Boletus reticuloceps]|uniref:FAD dependent oxidoreductase n=1 Tax=Boletus reticuloceps TaxID=495285 RepID=A0A8I2YYK2_9AGAM|nr:FAD dependent oxidoreductase [Boletus reticuloceps]
MATLFVPQNKWVSIDHSDPKPAGLPSQNPTRSFWADSSPDANPLSREGSTGPLITDADVCIIGSGITGVGVAYHLSEAIETNCAPVTTQGSYSRGERLLCVFYSWLSYSLDVGWCADGLIGAGATGRNGGHLTPAAFSEFHDRASKYGPEEAKRSNTLEAHTASSLVRIIQDHGWVNDVDLVHGGHIKLLCSDQQVESAQRDREAAVDAGWSLDGVLALSKEEVEATFGAHYPAVKIPGYNLWPLKLVTKLYQLAQSRTGKGFDLTLHTHTPVTAIQRENVSSSASEPSANATRAYRLLTPRGAIACSRVVHATNAYASHLLPFLAGPQGIVPVRGQVIATRASVGTDQIKINSWTANEGREYWFPRPIDSADEKPLVILGGAGNVVYVDDDTTCHPKVGESLRAFLPTVFEGKFERGREPEMEWTGIMGYTAIKDPFVGPIDKFQGTDITRYTGQFIAAGYSGHGMPLTPSLVLSSAEVVVQMIVAELTGTEWIQPEWLPTRYLTGKERELMMRN